MKRIDLSGKNFGKLQVQGRVENLKRTAWACLCKCGNQTIVTTENLNSGKTASCGCRKIEAAKENCAKYGLKPTHGMSNTPTWNTWAAMVYRCTNTKNRQFKSYGGMLCDRWKNFEDFFLDMGERPDSTSIDRIDVRKGYYKENCRWATSKQQQRNKTNTRYLLVNGKQIALMEFAELLGIKKPAAQYFFSVMSAVDKLNLEVEVWNG